MGDKENLGVGGRGNSNGNGSLEIQRRRLGLLRRNLQNFDLVLRLFLFVFALTGFRPL